MVSSKVIIIRETDHVRRVELRRDCLGYIVTFVQLFIVFDFKYDAFLVVAFQKSKFKIGFCKAIS
jgi:hypothetical protein